MNIEAFEDGFIQGFIDRGFTKEAAAGFVQELDQSLHDLHQLIKESGQEKEVLLKISSELEKSSEGEWLSPEILDKLRGIWHGVQGWSGTERGVAGGGIGGLLGLLLGGAFDHPLLGLLLGGAAGGGLGAFLPRLISWLRAKQTPAAKIETPDSGEGGHPPVDVLPSEEAAAMEAANQADEASRAQENVMGPKEISPAPQTTTTSPTGPASKPPVVAQPPPVLENPEIAPPPGKPVPPRNIVNIPPSAPATQDPRMAKKQQISQKINADIAKSNPGQSFWQGFKQQWGDQAERMSEEAGRGLHWLYNDQVKPEYKRPYIPPPQRV